MNGKLDGERQIWYDNGQLGMREFYRNGERDGKRDYWHENGHLHFQQFFRNEELIDEDFNFTKRRAFLRTIRYFRKYMIDSINHVLISDLAAIVFGGV